MAVTAYHCGSRKSEALLGTNDMNNALSLVAKAKVCEVELFYVVFQSDNLSSGIGFFDESADILVIYSRCCGGVLRGIPVSEAI
jgi:hypothetical protein